MTYTPPWRCGNLELWTSPSSHHAGFRPSPLPPITGCFLPNSVSSGLVMKVVTSAMITSMVKMRGERMPSPPPFRQHKKPAHMEQQRLNSKDLLSQNEKASRGFP